MFHCSAVNIPPLSKLGLFTACLHVAEDVLGFMQVAVEDETHGELSKDETQLMWKKIHHRGGYLFVFSIHFTQCEAQAKKPPQTGRGKLKKDSR